MNVLWRGRRSVVRGDHGLNHSTDPIQANIRTATNVPLEIAQKTQDVDVPPIKITKEQHHVGSGMHRSLVIGRILY